MSYELTRPLDFLDSFKNHDIIILLDDKTEITGVLLSFDIHLNIIVENAKEVSENSRHLGLIFLRGNKIVHISPLNTKISKFQK